MGNSPFKPEEVKTVWFPEFEEKLPSLAGKTVAITGCTSGTGFVVARTCAKKGAENVLLLNRPSERATKAEEEVKAAAVAANSSSDETQTTRTNVVTIPCDLQDFASVNEAINTIRSKYEAIDVLVNNAGVMALEDYATKDGYDVQMQTNHLSHFLLTQELFPLLKRAKELRGEARIVNHSSIARKGGPLKAEYFGKNGGNLGGNGNAIFPFKGAKWERYHQTKLANSVFTVALKDKLGETGIKAVSAAPGFAATNLQQTTSKSGGMDGAMWIMKFSQSAEDGTMPILAACFDPTTESGDFWEPSKYGGFCGPAVKVKNDSQTSNPDNVKLLWELSEAACGKFEIA